MTKETGMFVGAPDPSRKPTLTVEEAGELLGISRGSAYQAARDGTIPTLRIGRRVIVPTARLLAVLGLDGSSSSEPPTAA